MRAAVVCFFAAGLCGLALFLLDSRMPVRPPPNAAAAAPRAVSDDRSADQCLREMKAAGWAATVERVNYRSAPLQVTVHPEFETLTSAAKMGLARDLACSLNAGLSEPAVSAVEFRNTSDRIVARFTVIP